MTSSSFMIGSVDLGEIASAPATITDVVRIYAKDLTGTAHLYAIDGGGTEYQLTVVGGGNSTTENSYTINSDNAGGAQACLIIGSNWSASTFEGSLCYEATGYTGNKFQLFGTRTDLGDPLSGLEFHIGEEGETKNVGPWLYFNSGTGISAYQSYIKYTNGNVMEIGPSTIHVSIPGAGASSLRIGLNASAAGTGDTAVGDNADAASGQSTAFGGGAQATGAASIAIGNAASTNQTHGLAIGASAAVNVAGSGIAIGANCHVQAGNTSSIGIGNSSATWAPGGTHLCAIGAPHADGYIEKLVIGSSNGFIADPLLTTATFTTSGSSGASVPGVHVELKAGGHQLTSGTQDAGNVYISGGDASGLNTTGDGGDVIIRAGRCSGSSGTGTGGAVYIQTALVGTLATKMSFGLDNSIYFGDLAGKAGGGSDFELLGEAGTGSSTVGGDVTVSAGIGKGESTPGTLTFQVADTVAAAATIHTQRVRFEIAPTSYSASNDLYFFGGSQSGVTATPNDQTLMTVPLVTTSNTAGGAIKLASGGATGNAVPGSAIMQVSEPVGSGTTAQALYDRLRVGVSAAGLCELEQCITIDNARLVLHCETEDLNVGSGTTADTSIVIPALSIFMGATAKVITAIAAGPATWDFGETSDRNVFADNQLPALNTEVVADLSGTSDMPTQISSAQTLGIEAGDTVTSFTGTGDIRITAWWYEHEPGDDA